MKSNLSNTNRALCVLNLLVLALGTNLAEAVTPRAAFGSALITGAEKRISVSRVPVINSAGVVTYKDITINFEVSSSGVLTLAPFNPTITASPSLLTSGFKAGNYKDGRGNKYVVSGPSAIPNTTRTAWSMAFVSGPDATQFSMGWVTGPITGHPNESSLKARRITTTAYSWGIVGSENEPPGYTSFPFYTWGTNRGHVVGAAQAGNQVVFHLFSDLDNIEDGSVSLTLCATVC
jgi:hypothetical protein